MINPLELWILCYFELKQRVYELGEVRYVASRLSIINHSHKTDAAIFSMQAMLLGDFPFTKCGV